jgi:hypothetical protein
MDRNFDNAALELGLAHVFLSADVDAVGTGGWRYLGRPGGETTIVRGEQRLGIDLDEVQGSQIREFAGPAHVQVRHSLAELSLHNIAETRPGSMLFMDEGTPVAVGIGRESHLDLTGTAPTLMIVPEWCNLAAMAADATHADWFDVIFVWRAVPTEQGQFSLSPQQVATAPVTFTGLYAQTPAGLAQNLPEGFALYFQGNPKRIPVAHAMNAVGAAIVVPNLSGLLSAFDPAAFRDESYDAYYGDAFAVGGGMEFVGRMRGARNLTFATQVAATTTEFTGQTPIRATAVGAVAAAELTIMELGIPVLRRYARSRTEVKDGAALVGVGAGGSRFSRVALPLALLLRPSSAADGDRSRDIILWHAVPTGDWEETFRRATRDMTLRFQARVWDGAQVPNGAKVALWGDAVAAGIPVTYE